MGRRAEGPFEEILAKTLGEEGFSDFAVLDSTVEDSGQREQLVSLYRRWIEAGHHGGMKYLETHARMKYSPGLILPGASTLILVVVPYYQERREPLNQPSPSVTIPPRGKIARYAWGRDYHKVVGKKLVRIAGKLSGLFPGEQFRAFVDAGPIDERYFAWKAGLGTPGRHGLLITPAYGSWVFIGEILTTKKSEPRHRDNRGMEQKEETGLSSVCPRACTICRDSCPTGALKADGGFDARRCISYLTIEHHGAIPEELRPLIGDRFFGCELCQEVCPLNKGAISSGEADFLTPIAGESVDIEKILRIRSHEEMVERFAGSPVMRLGPERLLRNALIVAGNSGDPAMKPHIHALTEHADPLVAEHALWALEQS